MKKRKTSTVQKPWLKNKAWADNNIQIAGKNTWLFLMAFGLIWSLISALAVPDIPAIYRNDWLKGSVLIAFCSVGYAIIICALYSFCARLKFCDARVTLDPFPGSINGDVGGYLQLKLPFEQLKNETINLTLSCRSKHKTKEGGKIVFHNTCLYQLQGTADIQQSKQGYTRLYFRFNLQDVPQDLPASQQPADSYCYWNLETKIPLPGIDFNQCFEIPVYHLDQKSTSNTLRNIDSSKALITQTQKEQQPNNTVTIKKITGGLEIHSPPSKENENDTAFLVVGSVFSAIGIGMGIYGAPIIPALLFTLIGLGSVCMGLINIFGSLNVRINYNGITISSFIFGFQISRKTLSKGYISKVKVTVKNHQEHNLRYNIVADSHQQGNNKTITLARNISNIKIGEQILSKITSTTGIPSETIKE